MTDQAADPFAEAGLHFAAPGFAEQPAPAFAAMPETMPPPPVRPALPPDAPAEPQTPGLIARLLGRKSREPEHGPASGSAGETA